MSAGRFALVAFLALLVAFVSANVIAGAWLRAARFDLTENRLYTLSPGSRAVLDDLDEPITLTLYFSRTAAAGDPLLAAHGVRVREMLATYARRSRGHVRVLEIDPQRFSDAEDQAIAEGMTPFAGRGDPIFLGVSGANEVDEKIAIPQLTPEREAFLEYELTRTIAELDAPSKATIGLLTSLPWEPPAIGPQALAEMGRLGEVRQVARDFAAIDEEIDVLAVIHPWALTEQQLYAIDQFLMRKGRALIALDPAALAAEPLLIGPAGPAASALPRLLSAWGVAVSEDVVLDRLRALPIESAAASGAAVPQPLFFEVTPEQVDRADIITAGMARGLNFGAAGAISWSPRPQIVVTPLATTSGDVTRIPAAVALSRPDPAALLANFAPRRQPETVAARISGRLNSAFGAARPPGVAATPDAPHVARARQATVVLVADVDWLSDAFYLAGEGRAPVKDNGAFFLNALDQLAGSEALISLRSRAPALRPMSVLDRMAAEARERVAQNQKDLESELAQTEARIRTLDMRGRGSGFFDGELGAELTGEERSEIERFRARALALRKELRGVERGYRADIERLEGWLMLLNVWLAPALVAGGGLFWIWRRQRRLERAAARNITRPA